MIFIGMVWVIVMVIIGVRMNTEERRIYATMMALENVILHRAIFQTNDGFMWRSRPMPLNAILRSVRDRNSAEVTAHIHSSRGFDRGILIAIEEA